MTAVDVYIYERHAGVLTHRSTAGDATEFRLSDEYREDPERPILGQVFEDDPGRVWKTTHRVPPWFSNLLPEGPLRTLLAEQAGVNPERELHLLAVLGEDLPGAVTVTPRAASNLETSSVRPMRPTVDDQEALRFSLAGLQLKFSLNIEGRVPTIPVRGQGGRWIAKLPDIRFPEVPINEATMLAWARRSGITVPDFDLVDTTAIQGLPSSIVDLRRGKSLIIRRFDRLDDGGSLHIEDFAQIVGAAGEFEKYNMSNYESIGRTLLALCGVECLREYVRRLVFMIISGNADMHLKNWSLLYVDRRRAALAPAYDLVATRAFPGTDRRLALTLARTRKFEEIDRSSFRRLARKVKFDQIEMIAWFDEARTKVRESWPEIRDELPKDQRLELERHMARLRF